MLNVKMWKNKMLFRHSMLLISGIEKNITELTAKKCFIYGDGTVAESTVSKWLATLRSEYFDLKN